MGEKEELVVKIFNLWEKDRFDIIANSCTSIEEQIELEEEFVSLKGEFSNLFNIKIR